MIYDNELPLWQYFLGCFMEGIGFGLALSVMIALLDLIGVHFAVSLS